MIFASHDPYYGWTPKLIRDVINGNGLPNERETEYKVTDWKTALSDGSKHYSEIDFYDEPFISERTGSTLLGEPFYDLPLNGTWAILQQFLKSAG